MLRSLRSLKLKGKKAFRRRSHSTWKIPEGKETGVKVKNSLTNTLNPLVIGGEVITWYSCGPTVYDQSHIGHARNYVCIDIMQRILSNYFNIPVLHLMGVTDVDDKIINRSKEMGEHPIQLAKRYEHSFFTDLISLNVRI